MKTTTWESSESPSGANRNKCSPSYASTSTVLTVSRLPPSPLISTPPVLTTPASANHSPCSPGRKASNDLTDHSSRRTRLKTQWQGIWLTIKSFKRRFIVFGVFAHIFVLFVLIVIFFAFYIIFRILKSFHVCGFPVNEDTVILLQQRQFDRVLAQSVACVQTSPISFVSRGRVTSAQRAPLLILQHIFSVSIKEKRTREHLHAGHALHCKSVDILIGCYLLTIDMYKGSGLVLRPVCCWE